jgi:hypothetical protein
MPQVGLEPTIPVFERAKTVHSLDRSATVIGSTLSLGSINTETWSSRLGVGRKADALAL